jgi:integrase
VTALHTGFRVAELLSLTWQDVDFRRGVVTARAGYAKNGEGRSVPMSDTLTTLLKSGKVDGTREKGFSVTDTGSLTLFSHNL